jgi:HPt (histidine-containing phosphotransfer) domain-containing protein
MLTKYSVTFEASMSSSGRNDISESASKQVLNCTPDTLETAPIDFSVLATLRNLCDSEQAAFSDEILELFIRELEPRVGAIRDAIWRLDANTLALAAHALKGSSKLIGALPMAELCERLEQTVKTGTLAMAQSLLCGLEREAKRVHEALATLKA